MASPWNCPLPPLPGWAGSTRADLCVVGLGPVGLAACGLAARLGVRVLGVDVHPLGEVSGARGAGLLRAAAPPGVSDPIRAEEWVALHLAGLARREGGAVLFHGSVRRDDGAVCPADLAVDPRERSFQLAERAWEEGAWLYTAASDVVLTDEGARSDSASVRAPVVLDVRENGSRTRILARRGPDDPPAERPWWSGDTLASPGPHGEGLVEGDDVVADRFELDRFGVPAAPAAVDPDRARPRVVVVPEHQAWAEAVALALVRRMVGRGEPDLVDLGPSPSGSRPARS